MSERASAPANGWMSITAVQIDTGRCLNARFASLDCHRCADICPVDAIHLAGTTPVLVAGACVRCGACTVARPSDAFATPHLPEARTRRAAHEVTGPADHRATVLGCPASTGHHRSTQDVAFVIHGRCLASLDADDLLELAHDGRRELWLDDRPCSTCPIAPLRSHIANTARRANEVLEVFGRRSAIRLTDDDAGTCSASEAAAAHTDARNPRTTRRGFLRSLGREVTDHALDERPPAPPHLQRSLPLATRLSTSIPPSHARLTARIAAWPTPDDLPETRATGPTVDPGSCSGCSLCARFCPSGALSWNVTTSDATRRFDLTINHRDCTICGICVQACPEGAVSFAPTATAPDLAGRRHRTLAAGALGRCPTCNDDTAILDPLEPSQCSWCRHGEEPVTALTDGAGLMDDLLRSADLLEQDSAAGPTRLLPYPTLEAPDSTDTVMAVTASSRVGLGLDGLGCWLGCGPACGGCVRRAARAATSASEWSAGSMPSTPNKTSQRGGWTERRGRARRPAPRPTEAS